MITHFAAVNGSLFGLDDGDDMAKLLLRWHSVSCRIIGGTSGTPRLVRDVTVVVLAVAMLLLSVSLLPRPSWVLVTNKSSRRCSIAATRAGRAWPNRKPAQAVATIA
jgi:hypothetical protein